MIYSFVVETDSISYDQKIVDAVKKVFNMKHVRGVSLANETAHEIEKAEDNKRISCLVQQMQSVINELAKAVNHD